MERGWAQSKEQAHHSVPMLKVLRRVRGSGGEDKAMIHLTIGKLPGRKKNALSLIDVNGFRALAWFVNEEAALEFEKIARRGIKWQDD